MEYLKKASFENRISQYIEISKTIQHLLQLEYLTAKEYKSLKLEHFLTLTDIIRELMECYSFALSAKQIVGKRKLSSIHARLLFLSIHFSFSTPQLPESIRNVFNDVLICFEHLTEETKELQAIEQVI